MTQQNDDRPEQWDDWMVSVVIPSFNRAHLLPRAVESVLRQSHQALEVIIVDDGSTDGTASVAARLVEEDSRVRFVPLTHGGAPRARNAGIDLARGEFLAFQDTDDAWDPEFIEHLLPVAVEDPRVVAFSSHRLVDRDGDAVTVPDRWIEHPARLLACKNITSTQTVLMRRSLLTSSQVRFDEGLKRFQDWDLWIQLLEKGAARFHHVPTVLVTLYRQPDSISGGRELRRMGALIRILTRRRRYFLRRPHALIRLVVRIVLGPLKNVARTASRSGRPS